jgi:hypothetical protein
MEKHLLTEISRVKEIMGLSLLSEGIDDLVKKLLGVSDESAESIAKSADEIGSELSTALKQIVGGTGTYDDLVSYVARTKGGSTFDDIITFVKSQPELLKKIATSSDIIMKNAAQEIIKKSNVTDLLTKTTIDVVDDLLNLNIRSNNTDSIIPMIDSAITTLKPYSWNSDIDELITKLEDRKSIAENLKSGLSSPTPKSYSQNIDGDLARAESEALKRKNTNKSISDIKSYIQTGDWSKLGWTPTFINPYKKEMLEWFNLKIKDFESGVISADKLMYNAKSELSQIVKKKSLKNLNKVEKDGYWLFKSLQGSKGGFWTSPVGISALIGLGFAAHKGYLLYFAADFYKNNNKAIDEINKGDNGSKTAQDAYESVVKNDPNLEGQTIDESSWKLVGSDEESGEEVYSAKMNGSPEEQAEYTFVWDGNKWEIK